jgi:bifunctional DNA-binding transcriptional regulator/antitoxin component of YhaV-PrlF toxin-antitoxin module
MHDMERSTTTTKVSERGQTSVPAALRRRWDIVDGGELTFIDLGHAALVLPGDGASARAELRRVLVSDGGYENGLDELDDPDLADQ